MDKLINSHIDKVEAIEGEIDVIIEREIKAIKIDEVTTNPSLVLQMVAEKIKQIYLDEYAHKIVELGIDFGRLINKRIEQDRTIKVDNSDDPQLNDTGKDNK